MRKILIFFLFGVGAFGGLPTKVATAAGEQPHDARRGVMSGGTSGPGLFIPFMDASRGKKLFASKGCVICHAINGVGGDDATPLDASRMKRPMNPFEFTAAMWRGAEAMILLQREEIGDQIELTGQELADIIAFAHDANEQKIFSNADIPSAIRKLMKHEKEKEKTEER